MRGVPGKIPAPDPPCSFPATEDMKQSLQSRTVVILLVIFASAYGLAGFPGGASGFLAKLRESVRFGSGPESGSQFILQVQVQDAVKAEADRVIQGLRESLAREGVRFTAIERNDPATPAEAGHLQITVKGVEPAGALQSLIDRSYSLRNVSSGSSTDYVLRFKESRLRVLKSRAVEHSLHAIGQRLGELGLADAAVRLYGPAETRSQIMVQVPGGHDPDRVREIVRSAAADVNLGEFNRSGILPSISELSSAHGVNESRRRGPEETFSSGTGGSPVVPRREPFPDTINKSVDLAFRRALAALQPARRGSSAGINAGDTDAGSLSRLRFSGKGGPPDGSMAAPDGCGRATVALSEFEFDTPVWTAGRKDHRDPGSLAGKYDRGVMHV